MRLMDKNTIISAIFEVAFTLIGRQTHWLMGNSDTVVHVKESHADNIVLYSLHLSVCRSVQHLKLLSECLGGKSIG